MNATDGGGGDLLAPLREMDIDDSPPPGYDVAAAMRRAGTIRRRRITTGVIAVAVLGAVAVPAILRQAPGGRATGVAGGGTFPVAACTGRAIAAPAGAGAYTSVIGAEIDPTGRYLALTIARPDVPDFGATRVALQDRRTGTTSMVPIDNAFAVAVNSSGTVLGWVDTNVRSAWLYQAGRVVALPLYNDETVEPTAINSRGEAVGYATDERISSGADNHTAVIWPAGSSPSVRALDGLGSMANSISDEGVVGGSRDVFGLAAPAVWNATGTANLLPTGDVGHSGAVQSVAGNYAVGEVQFDPVPVVWNLATGRLQFYPRKVEFWWVSPSGTAVGGLHTSPGTPDGAVIARGGKVRQLPDIDRLDGQFASGASADLKTIVGTAYANANEYALLWTC